MNESEYGKEVRSVQKIGGSMMVSLPKGYVKNHHIKKGDKIEILYGLEEFRGRLVDIQKIKEQFVS